MLLLNREQHAFSTIMLFLLASPAAAVAYPLSIPSECLELAPNATATWTGRPLAFVLAIGTVLVWTITGPIFDYSDTWQLVINTGTTIITFLMVFLIQNTQNRDTLALSFRSRTPTTGWQLSKMRAMRKWKKSMTR